MEAIILKIKCRIVNVSLNRESLPLIPFAIINHFPSILASISQSTHLQNIVANVLGGSTCGSWKEEKIELWHLKIQKKFNAFYELVLWTFQSTHTQIILAWHGCIFFFFVLWEVKEVKKQSFSFLSSPFIHLYLCLLFKHCYYIY